MDEILELRTVQRAQLDLLLELDRICKKNDIKYFLVGGSLIGAIRHKGFIPWDDDIDLGMLREDYEKFKDIVNMELDLDYAFFDWRNDPKSPHPFGKLKIKGSVYMEKEARKTGMNNEIFIDIFPFDKAPDVKKLQKRQKMKVLLLRKILQLKLGWELQEGKGIRKRILYVCLKIIALFRPLDKWKDVLNAELQRYSNTQSKKRVNMCGAYAYEKEMVPNEFLNKVIATDFEGYQVCIPEMYHEYLTKLYGDYMQLPPVEKRANKHGIIESSLGSYKIRCKAI